MSNEALKNLINDTKKIAARTVEDETDLDAEKSSDVVNKQLENIVVHLMKSTYRAFKRWLDSKPTRRSRVGRKDRRMKVVK